MTRWLNCKHSVIGILNTRTLLCVQPLGWVCLPFRSAQLDSALIGKSAPCKGYDYYYSMPRKTREVSLYTPGIYADGLLQRVTTSGYI